MENRPVSPLCDQCKDDHELTVKHILIECNLLKTTRCWHYTVTDLIQLIKTILSKKIIDFVEYIGLYNNSLQQSLCVLEIPVCLKYLISSLLWEFDVQVEGGTWR